MKTIKILSLLFATGLFMASCSNDDETPEEVNEEETITTMTVFLVPQGGGATVTFVSMDLDGDGPNAPVITPDDIVLAANTTYSGTVSLLNQTETPSENINEEIEAEADEHQFIFTIGAGLNASTAYADEESDYVSGETGENFTTNNPVGILFTLTTTDASTGTFTVTLRHEPTKPNDGTLAGAGGETDITQTFDVTIE